MLFNLLERITFSQSGGWQANLAELAIDRFSGITSLDYFVAKSPPLRSCDNGLNDILNS